MLTEITENLENPLEPKYIVGLSILATVVLSLAGKLEGNITGAILSGIVGYVLGQLSLKKED